MRDTEGDILSLSDPIRYLRHREIVQRPRRLQYLPSHFLQIDDEAMIRALLRTVLEWEGYEVVEAVNGAEGLSASAPQSAPTVQCCQLVMEERSNTEASGEQRYDAYPQHLKDALITVTFRLVVRQQRGCSRRTFVSRGAYQKSSLILPQRRPHPQASLPLLVAVLEVRFDLVGIPVTRTVRHILDLEKGRSRVGIQHRQFGCTWAILLAIYNAR